MSGKYTGDAVQQVIGSHASFQVNDSWLISTQMSESRDQAENYTNSSSTSEIDTRHRFVNVTNTINLNSDNILNVGLDYDDDHIDSTKDYLETSRDNKAGFISWVGNGDRSSWLLSGRHDDNEPLEPIIQARLNGDIG